jgi:hypothetical protein
MSRRYKLLFVGTWLFALVNVAGAGYAIAVGEGLHAAVHAGLLVPSVYYARRLAQRRRDVPSAAQVSDRLEHLQESLDAIALEVERIGEAQRFMTKLVAERREAVPAAPHPDSPSNEES